LEVDFAVDLKSPAFINVSGIFHRFWPELEFVLFTGRKLVAFRGFFRSKLIEVRYRPPMPMRKIFENRKSSWFARWTYSVLPLVDGAVEGPEKGCGCVMGIRSIKRTPAAENDGRPA